MKIVFVEPSGQENVFSNQMSLPLLGPIYLGTILKKHCYDVEVLNENILKRRISFWMRMVILLLKSRRFGRRLSMI